MKQTNFAVIGCGSFSATHLRAIANSIYATLVAVCDIDEERAKNRAEEFGAPFYCVDYHELMKRNDIDVYCVVTQDQMHREITVELLNAGKNVLCEKPLALNSEDCRAIIEAAEKSTGKLMVGQVCRMTPGFVAAKELVDKGVIGELVFVESEYAHDYSEMKQFWRKDPASPRHIVTGGGCHAIDLLRWIAGDPVEAYGYANRKILKDWPTDDTAIAVLKFPNDVIGKVFVSSACKRNYTMRTVLYGTKGTIITDNTSPTISLFVEEFEGKRKFMDYSMKTIEIKLPVNVNNHNVVAEIEDFIQVISGEKEQSITAREGAATVAVCEAIIASTASGKPERIKYV